MSETLQAYNCSTCSLSFSSDVRYKEHYKSDFHRYNLKRQLISLPSVSVEQYEKQFDQSTNRSTSQTELRCEICSKSFMSHSTYGQHIVSQKHKQRRNELTRKEKLKSLKKSKSSTSSEFEVLSETSKMTKSEQCPFCNKQYSAKHLAMHNFPPFKDNCLDLDGLVEKVRSIIEEHRCPHCEAQFHSVESTKQHMIDVGHMGLNPEHLEQFEQFYIWKIEEEDEENDDNSDEPQNINQKVTLKDVEQSMRNRIVLTRFGAKIRGRGEIGVRRLRRYYKQYFREIERVIRQPQLALTAQNNLAQYQLCRMDPKQPTSLIQAENIEYDELRQETSPSQLLICIHFLVLGYKTQTLYQFLMSKFKSTVELIQCEMLKDVCLVLYLYEHREHEEVVRAIVKKLKTLMRQRMLQLLPEIIFVFQNHPHKIVQRFLYEVCQGDYEAYLTVKWAFNSYTLNSHKSNAVDQSFENMRNHMDSHIINGKTLNLHEIPEEKMEEFINKWAEEKEQRSNYLVYMSDFYGRLMKLPTKLKDISQENRNSELVHTLQKSFVRHLRRASTLSNNLSAGLHFPTGDGSNFIVRVVYEMCHVYSTRERVPFKFVFETVSFDELCNSDVKYDLLKSIPLETIEEVEKTDSFLQTMESQSSYSKKEKKLAQQLSMYLKEANKNLNTQSPMNTQIEDKKIECLKLHHSAFSQNWSEKVNQLRQNSPFKNLSSFRVRGYIIKTGDDIRQEHFAMELIKLVNDVFTEMNIPLWIRTYQVIMFGSEQGFIEYLPNTMTISSLKKYTRSLKSIYRQNFGDQWDVASKNFTNSLAGYSLISYIFQIKDRHNGNLLIDSVGHIIHIDFGFMLGTSPGNMNFEKAPFKLTQDYIDLMGGIDSDMFSYFKQLLCLGFIYIKRHADDIIKFIDVMKDKSNLPCFRYYDKKELLKRLMLKATDDEIRKNVQNLIYYSANALATRQYDTYQEYTNGICK